MCEGMGGMICLSDDDRGTLFLFVVLYDCWSNGVCVKVGGVVWYACLPTAGELCSYLLSCRIVEVMGYV
jgi:hypothetical protein